MIRYIPQNEWLEPSTERVNFGFAWRSPQLKNRVDASVSNQLMPYFVA
jgi:hypothetical protein